MSDFARLLRDVEQVGSMPGGRGARALSGVVDLFTLSADSFEDAHLALFDAVFERLLDRADERVRAGVAERIAPLGRVPRETLIRLAGDEIVVARPILAASPCLTDQDIVAVCVARGRDHMLAVCERACLSEMVTDILVAHGDAVVHHAVATNPTARFSRLSAGTLVELARADQALLELLGERSDLPDGQARQIAALVRDIAQRQLGRAFPSEEVVVIPGAPLDGIGAGPLPTERSLADDAREGRHAAVLAALTYLSGLPAERARKLYDERDDELLVVVARARDWSFDTVRAIMTGRSEPAGTHLLWMTERNFANLSPSTASRILRFIRLRNSHAAVPPQRRSNVR